MANFNFTRKIYSQPLVRNENLEQIYQVGIKFLAKYNQEFLACVCLTMLVWVLFYFLRAQQENARILRVEQEIYEDYSDDDLDEEDFEELCSKNTYLKGQVSTLKNELRNQSEIEAENASLRGSLNYYKTQVENHKEESLKFKQENKQLEAQIASLNHDLETVVQLLREPNYSDLDEVAHSKIVENAAELGIFQPGAMNYKNLRYVVSVLSAVHSVASFLGEKDFSISLEPEDNKVEDPDYIPEEDTSFLDSESESDSSSDSDSDSDSDTEEEVKMSSSIKMRMHRATRAIYHPDSKLVFRSAKDRTIIGRLEDDEVISLDKKAISLCEKYNLKYDESLIEKKEVKTETCMKKIFVKDGKRFILYLTDNKFMCLGSTYKPRFGWRNNSSVTGYRTYLTPEVAKSKYNYYVKKLLKDNYIEV